MFSLFKSIIWFIGFFVVAKFALDFFGYELNRRYFQESKAKCIQELNACRDKYIHHGIDNTTCSFLCIEPKNIIKRKETR